jgi:hypothetical protein
MNIQFKGTCIATKDVVFGFYTQRNGKHYIDNEGSLREVFGDSVEIVNSGLSIDLDALDKISEPEKERIIQSFVESEYTPEELEAKSKLDHNESLFMNGESVRKLSIEEAEAFRNKMLEAANEQKEGKKLKDSKVDELIDKLFEVAKKPFKRVATFEKEEIEPPFNPLVD